MLMTDVKMAHKPSSTVYALNHCQNIYWLYQEAANPFKVSSKWYYMSKAKIRYYLNQVFSFTTAIQIDSQY